MYNLQGIQWLMYELSRVTHVPYMVHTACSVRICMQYTRIALVRILIYFNNVVTCIIYIYIYIYNAYILFIDPFLFLYLNNYNIK